MPRGDQNMFDLPEFFILKYFIFKPITLQIEIDFQNVFHWDSTYFVHTFISPHFNFKSLDLVFFGIEVATLSDFVFVFLW